MFATDVAARGLDFPDVDWIVQMDAPDSVQTYIHRVGRTARYRAGGKALLFVCPSELPLVDKITQSKVALKRTKVNPSQIKSIASAFQSFMVEDADLKFLGQKALLSYLKSIYLQSDKDVFDLHRLDVHAMALSMGLPSAPKLSIALNQGGVKEKNRPYALKELEEGRKKKGKKAKEDQRGMTEMDRLLNRKNQGVLSEARLRMVGGKEGTGEESEEDEVLTIKRKDHQLEEEQETAGEEVGAEEVEEADEEEAAVPTLSGHRLRVKDEEGTEANWLQQAAQTLAEEDPTDKQREKERSAAVQHLHAEADGPAVASATSSFQQMGPAHALCQAMHS